LGLVLLSRPMETPVTSASAPPAAAAPAVAASTSTTAPVTSTPATSTPVADGQQGSGALDSGAAINAMVEAAKNKGFGEDLTQTKPAAETPAAANGATDTETPAASETETPAADDAEVQQDQDHTYSLEEDGHIGARDLATKLDAEAPAMSKETRDAILATARVAERNAAYETLFASPAEAKIISETAQQYATYSEAFGGIQADPEKGTTEFLNRLIEASALRDDQGNPIKNENGTFKTDGTANKFVETLGKRYINRFLVKKIESMPEGEDKENALAALDLVMGSAGLRTPTADKTQDQDPALAARKAELDAQEARINQERATSQTEQKQQYESARDTELVSTYDTEVGKLLDAATGLDKFTRKAVEKDLETAIRGAIKTNVAYKQRKAQIQRMPMSPARRQQEVALAKEFFQDHLVRIAKPILAEAGVTIAGKSAQRTETQAARAASARSEVNGSSGTRPNPAATTQTPAQQMDAARAEYKQQNGGKDPDDSELNIFMMLKTAKARGLAA
jgi:hypothetical protein